MMAAMVNLTDRVEESMSDVIDYGPVSHLVTCSRDELRRAMLSFHLSAS